jgi:hypothetical protein
MLSPNEIHYYLHAAEANTSSATQEIPRILRTATWFVPKDQPGSEASVYDS